MAPNEPPIQQKLSIYSVEGPRIVVTAMYNPKELQVDKAVPWTRSPQSKGDQPSLEFSGADGRSMSFELMFDGFETGTNVHTAFGDNLVKLALVQDPNGAEDKKRPPKVGVKWGVAVRATCRVTVREASHLSVAKP